MTTHRVTCTDMTITHDKIHDSNYNNIPAMTVNIFSTPMEVFKIIPCGHDDVFVPLFCLIVAVATHTTDTHTVTVMFIICHYLITLNLVFDMCNCCDFNYGF
jgi:hypothetical protein